MRLQLTSRIAQSRSTSRLASTNAVKTGDYYGVARRPCGRPALSELAVKVSLHPAQALRTPLWRRRGFETERR